MWTGEVRLGPNLAPPRPRLAGIFLFFPLETAERDDMEGTKKRDHDGHVPATSCVGSFEFRLGVRVRVVSVLTWGCEA
jgi:hypothetical protein